MNQPASQISAFYWRGQPSIFALSDHPTVQEINEFNAAKRAPKPGKAVSLVRKSDKACKPVAARNRAGRPSINLDLDAVREMRAQGNTWDQIGERLGCSSETVRTRCGG